MIKHYHWKQKVSTFNWRYITNHGNQSYPNKMCRWKDQLKDPWHYHSITAWSTHSKTITFVFLLLLYRKQGGRNQNRAATKFLSIIEITKAIQSCPSANNICDLKGRLKNLWHRVNRKTKHTANNLPQFYLAGIILLLIPPLRWVRLETFPCRVFYT